MAKISTAVRIGFAGLMVAALVACAPVYRNHGWAPSDTELAAIETGRDTRESVAEKVGRPRAEGVLADSAWYYVESSWQHGGYRAPQEIDRQVVAISFASNGTVSNVERFGLEQGEVVALSRRTTTTGVATLSFLRQLMGSIGRISPGQYEDR